MRGGTPIDRRALIGIGAMLGGAVAIPAAARAPTRLRLVAGTYVGEGGKGLYPLTFDMASASWSVGDPEEAIRDASFGVRSRRPGYRYFVDETRGTIGLWREGRRWTALAHVPAGGDGPCYLALDAAQSCFAVADYGSGSVALYALDPSSGVPRVPPVVRTNHGRGPNAARQQGPHAHWVGFAPDGRWLHSVDLGTDTVLAYAFDAKAASIEVPRIAYHAPPGSGPRHLVRHPNLPCAYLVCEMGNIVIELATAPDGGFTETRIASTLPAGFAGKSYAGHIAIDRTGSRLYVSNRGHDSIAVFAIDAAGGLSLLQHVATVGSWPRFFLLCEDARLLIVANERGGSVVAFAIAADGRLHRVGGTAAVPGVVFLDRATI